MATGAIVGIQDMGAAGLTSTSCEMASRGGVGIEIDLAHVPQRESGMTAYEMMLSESQERMLLVAELGREQEVFAVFCKWGLDAVAIGKVTTDGMLRVLHHGQVMAEIPAQALAHEAPVYDRPATAPRPATSKPSDDLRVPLASRSGARPHEKFRRLLAAPNIASKRWDLPAVRSTWCAPTYGRALAQPTQPWCASKAPSALWRFPPMETAAGARSILTQARCTPSPRRRATWPPRGRAPWLPLTASTSAILKSPK